jgi:hypothetical protein
VVGPGEADEDLGKEIEQACGKFGTVIQSLVFEATRYFYFTHRNRAKNKEFLKMKRFAFSWNLATQRRPKRVIVST